MIIQFGQVALIISIIAFALYTFRLRTVSIDRLVYLVLIGAGIAFAIQPQLSSWLANRIGIGRGADLVVYTFIIFSLFQMVSVTSHMNKLERQITILVRQCAILGAVRGASDQTRQAGDEPVPSAQHAAEQTTVN